MGGTTGTQFEPPSVAKASNWKVWGPVIAGGISLLIGVAVALWSVFGHRGHGPSATPRPRADRTPRVVTRDAATRPRRIVVRDAAQPKEELVRLRIEVTPRSAKPVVVFRGREYVGALFETKVPKSHSKEVVLVRAKGFLPEALEYVPDEDRDLRVKLRQKRRPRRDELMDLP